MDDLLVVDLSDEERSMLRWGVQDWGGPASATDDLARVMGFESVADLLAEARRIAEAIWSGQGLSPHDWTRALVATEFLWVSDVYGSGLDSIHTCGCTDAEGIATLRSVQRKLLTAGARVPGRSLT